MRKFNVEILVQGEEKAKDIRNHFNGNAFIVSYSD